MTKFHKNTPASLYDLRDIPWSPEREERKRYLKARYRASYHTHLPDVRDKIFSRDNHQCTQCGSSQDLTIDHVLSIYSGGSDDDDNLQTLCRSCNSMKAP